MRISRRKSLQLAVGVSIAPLAAGGPAYGSPQPPSASQALSPDESPSEAELRQMQLDTMVTEDGANGADGAFTWQAYTLDNELRGVIRRERVIPNIKNGRLFAAVVPDTSSPDFNHLAGLGSPGASFTLDDALLTRLAAASGFDSSFNLALAGRTQPQNRIVIFGLRGTKLAPGATPRVITDRVNLVEAEIDHRNKNCVMGVWDRQMKQLAVFTASTVPHLMYMQMYRINLHLLGRVALDDASVGPDDVISEDEKAKKQLNWTANQLGQGLHLMQVGTHQGKYRNLLVQHTTWCGPVLRARDSLSFTVKGWDPSNGRVGDNIHPCWAVDGVDFSSAGCNLIEGQSKSAPGYGGPFADFLRMARLAAETGAAAGDTKTYYYMLLSGREARLHAGAAVSADPGLVRLRFGSSGASVKDLQTRLLRMPQARATGIFDLATHRALLKWQSAEGFAEDGVVAPDQLKI